MGKYIKIELPQRISVLVQSLILLHEEHQSKLNQICNTIEAIKQHYFSKIDLFDMMSAKGRQQTLSNICQQLGYNLLQQKQLLHYFGQLEILFEELKISNQLFHNQLELFKDQTLNKLQLKTQVSYLVKIISQILKERMEFKMTIIKYFDPLKVKSDDVFEERIKTADHDELNFVHSFQDKTVKHIKLNNFNQNTISTVNNQQRKMQKSQSKKKHFQQQQQQQQQQQLQEQQQQYYNYNQNQQQQQQIQQYQQQYQLQQKSYQQKQQQQPQQQQQYEQHMMNPLETQDLYINNQNCMVYPLYFIQQQLMYPALFYQFNNYPIQ